LKVVVTGPAEADIEVMLDFIRRDSIAAGAAASRALSDAILSPADLPLRGRVGRMRDTRELLVRRTSFILVYRVVGDMVAVMRVRHASQAWPPRP